MPTHTQNFIYFYFSWKLNINLYFALIFRTAMRRPNGYQCSVIARNYYRHDVQIHDYQCIIPYQEITRWDTYHLDNHYVIPDVKLELRYMYLLFIVYLLA